MTSPIDVDCPTCSANGAQYGAAGRWCVSTSDHNFVLGYYHAARVDKAAAESRDALAHMLGRLRELERTVAEHDAKIGGQRSTVLHVNPRDVIAMVDGRPVIKQHDAPPADESPKQRLERLARDAPASVAELNATRELLGQVQKGLMQALDLLDAELEHCDTWARLATPDVREQSAELRKLVTA